MRPPPSDHAASRAPVRGGVAAAAVAVLLLLLAPPPERAAGTGPDPARPSPPRSTLTGHTLTGPTSSASDAVGVWPLDPEPHVLAAFSPPDDPWGAGHRGVDLAGTPGQPVRAALPGQVSFVGSVAGRSVVAVRHGERRTTYEPVVGTLTRGAEVGAGDVVGRLVVPGSHCFPAACLHWGLLRGETYLDPLSLVGGGPIRLLPMLSGSEAPGRSALPTGPAARWRPVIRRWRPALDSLP